MADQVEQAATVMDLISLSGVVKAIGAIFVLLLALAMMRIINSVSNELEWWHLISTRAPDGTQYADWNKIGQGCGVVLCVLLPVVYVYSEKMEAGGLAAVLGVVLLYLGSVSGYAATLRARRGTTETITEPADVSGPVKITTTETPGGTP